MFVVSRWLEEHAPIYYQRVCEVVSPYLQLFWEKLYDLGVFLVEVTAPLREWLNAKVPVVLNWVSSCLYLAQYKLCSFYIFKLLHGI